MIRAVSGFSDIRVNSVEMFRIKSTCMLYPDIAQFWVSDEGGMISVLDGDAVVTGNFRKDELNGFLGFLSPRSVFCSEKTAGLIDLPYKREDVCVMERPGEAEVCAAAGDLLKSDGVYGILKVKGLDLPPADAFSVDFCRRLNRGALCYYAERDVCAAIAQLCDRVCLITGVASHQKGAGTRALLSVIKKADKKKVYAVCREEVVPFYEKNGFMRSYGAVYLTK